MFLSLHFHRLLPCGIVLKEAWTSVQAPAGLLHYFHPKWHKSKSGTDWNIPQFINLSAVFLHLYSAVLFGAAHIRKRSIHISSPFGRHPYGCPKFLSQKTDILLDIHFFFQCFSHSFRSQLEIGICHFNPHCLVSLLGSRKNRSTCSGKRI